jgi:hypothetical protein
MAADFSPYVDLTIYDAQPVDIYLGAIELARRTLPEFTLRQGTPEDALFQAFAYMSALSVGSINRLPPRLMEGLIKMIGMERRFGTRAQVVVDMTARDNDDETFIPAGTVFGYVERVGGISTQYTFQLADDVTIPSHISTPQTEQVVLYSQNVGVHPVLTSGDILTPLSVVSDLDSVVVATTITVADPPDATYPFVNGIEPESDTAYLARARTFMSSLNETLVNSRQVQAYVLSNYETVGRCLVFDLTKYDDTGASGSARIGGTNDPGYITVYVYGNKQLLPAAEKNSILTDVTNKSIAGLSVGIDDFHEVSVDIEIDVIFDDSFDETALEILLKEFIFNAVSRENFPLAEQHLRKSLIATVASSLDGVLSVGRIEFVDYTTGYALDTNGDLEFIYKGTLPLVGRDAKNVRLVTTAALSPSPTYSNGTSGVGATLTASGNGVLQVDGVNAVLNDRILVKNQADPKQNGIYKVTTAGTISVPYVLTRATDCDDEINFVIDRAILASAGSSNSGKFFAVSAVTGDEIGVDLEITYQDITSTYSSDNTGFVNAIMINATGRTV